MSTFDEDLFLKGLEQRKSTLGADHVEKNSGAADKFTRPFLRSIAPCAISHYSNPKKCIRLMLAL